MDELYEMWEPLWEDNQPVCLPACLPAFELLFSKETEINFATIGAGQRRQQQDCLESNTTRKRFIQYRRRQDHLDDWSSLRERWMEERVEEIVFERCCNDSHGDSTRHAQLPPMVHLRPCQGHCESILKLQNSVCRGLSTWPQS